MPNLKVVYDGKVLHDGDVERFTWDDAPDVVAFTGRRAKSTARRGASPLTGLLGALTQQGSTARHSGINPVATEEAAS